MSGAPDVALAVREAVPAADFWSSVPSPARGAALGAAARAIAEDAESIATVLTRETGKTLAESRSEIARTVEALDYCAAEGSRLAGETLPSEHPGRLVLTLREPVGVVAAITPWNYPAQILAWKVGPALVAGNAVVLKPSELAPGTASRIAHHLLVALDAAGAKDGTLNVVHGGAEAGAELVARPEIDAITFTGSVKTGLAIQAAAAQRGVRVLCEMGGKNPLVVLGDADVELAAAACVRGAFGNAGQRCTATSRAYASRGVMKKFRDAVIAGAEKLKVGPGIDPGSGMGPLSSDSARARVSDAVLAAVAAGAKIRCGGKAPSSAETANGSFYLPTVLEGVDEDSPLAQDELFGPVVLLTEVDDELEALSLANRSRFGLSASVYTRDLDRALAFARTFEAGIVHINSPTVGGETHVPFGGMKATSNGGRERGAAATEFFTRWKTIYLDTSR